MGRFRRGRGRGNHKGGKPQPVPHPETPFDIGRLSLAKLCESETLRRLPLLAPLRHRRHAGRSAIKRRFANVPVGRHARAYWPYVLAPLAGLMLIIAIPEPSLFLPRSAGMVR